MTLPYEMPKLAMAMNEGTLNEWLVPEGARVNVGDPIAVIETEKVAYDCEAPETGYLHHILPEGETVPVGTVIGVFCESEAELKLAQKDSGAGAQPDRPTPTSQPEESAPALAEIAILELAGAKPGGNRIVASPLAKKVASDHRVDLSRVSGTGPGGRIVKRDVLAVAESSQVSEWPAPLPAQDAGVIARIPMKGRRRAIATRMSESLEQTAQVSGHYEADITRLLEMRARLVARADSLGTRVSVNSLIIKAICTAVKHVPEVNACVEQDSVVIYRNVNIGLAVSMPDAGPYESSLAVAVLDDVDRMGLVEIDLQMKSLLDRVRNGKALPSDFSGSTITLSSTAGIGPPGMTSTPVLNWPNVFIVGPSTPIERPAWHEGKPSPRMMLPVSYTFDHRSIDGAPVARFNKALCEALTDPELMLA